MPISYRNFYIKKLINIKQKEQEEINKSQGKIGENTPLKKIVKGPY